MDAALEEMLAPRKARDVEGASLKDARPGHRDVLEATGALRNDRLAVVERLDEAAAELRDLGERVGSPPWSTTERVPPFRIVA